eukprot:CAMPEP_0181413258 /NCGR_PEP_ID=MMETSP1110-20121109/8877_1 /TAXON_ID=174948 /ORGANISM="Symbiodinium sp., Strain CCMP421" /LENGTH=34 /DNA_ID= /DNA_START= /DNA_END= /DNA_ORIENTATION=
MRQGLAVKPKNTSTEEMLISRCLGHSCLKGRSGT